MKNHLITLMIFLPFLGAVIQALLPTSKGSAASIVSRQVALCTSLFASICSIVLLVSLQTGTPDLQATETLPWIGSYAISYEVGLDGLNALLVLLIAIVSPVLIASEWHQKSGARGMHALLLVLQASLFGAVCAQDLFLMFFFWALSSLPFYFLIGIWGGEGRERAAFQSIVSASIGNALLFGALVLVYYSVDPHTFSLKDLSAGKVGTQTFPFLGMEAPVSAVAFALMSAGLALRAPVWPFHGWFTHVAEEAPASVFVALGGLAVPVATALFIRLAYSLFPATVAEVAPVVVIVGAVNLVVGAICAAGQRDLRRLLAFVCLSEVGLVLIGAGSLSQAGAVGAVYQELTLGLGVAGFGLFSGILMERSGTSAFKDDDGKAAFGGLATRTPAMAVVAGIIVASLLGFPGLGGFVGHSLLVIGSYSIHPWAVAFVAFVFVLAAYYLLGMYRYVFLGRAVSGASFRDLSPVERVYLLPVVAALVVIGVYPKPLLDVVRPTVLTLLSVIH